MLNSLRIKILLLFILGLTLLSATIITIFIYETYERDKNIFIERADNAALQLALKTHRLFQLGLLTNQFVGYKRLCKTILNENKELSYIGLHDKRDKSIFFVGDLISYKKSLNEKLDDFILTVPLVDSFNEKYSIIVLVNKSLIEKETYELLKRVIIYASLANIFIVILVIIYLRVNLGEPLSSLISRINNVESDHLKNKKWELLKRKDELGTVANSFDELIKRLFISQNSLKKTNEKLRKLNKELDKKVEKEVQKNRQKDIQLFEQSKMATMTEMLKNIAHQWRQPLSVISTISTSFKLQKEFGKLSDDDIFKAMDNINEKAQYLSKTIETFRGFLCEKELKEVLIQDKLIDLLYFVNETLKSNNITLKKKFINTQGVKISLNSTDFSQAIINILNNSKEALLEKNVQKPWIELELIKNEDNILLTIEDNAGGIEDEVMLHMFEPYYTTKHKFQGIGLGLHLSYKIITESLHGKIYAKNTDFGAKFFIEIPFPS